MKIKSIEIENFKGIVNKTLLNFEPNKSGIENDLKYGLFIKEGKHIIPSSIGIIGKNGIGKTSILDAVNYVFTALQTNLFIDLALQQYETRKFYMSHRENNKWQELLSKLKNIENKQYTLNNDTKEIYHKYIISEYNKNSSKEIKKFL